MELASDDGFVVHFFSRMTTEYYAVLGQAVAIASGDKLITSYDSELSADEILVINGGSLAWSLSLLYPQTGISNFIASGTGNYTLNGGDAATGTKPSVKTWFRLPANSTLELTFSAVTTSGKVELLVVGR